MRILFSSTRGAGHLQPLLPYARALIASGHEVLIAGPPDLRETLHKEGLAHAPFGHPGDQGLAPIWARLRTLPADQHPAIWVREIFAGANARAALPALLETLRIWKPHLVVRDSAEFAAVVAAQIVGVPHVRVAVHQRMVEEHMHSLAAAPVDRMREEAGLAKDDGAAMDSEPIFTSFPESFEGPPSGTNPRLVCRVGTSSVSPPVATTDWVPECEQLPLVYVSFGTIASTTPEALSIYQTAIAAVSMLQVGALLTTGRGFDIAALGVIPANVRVETWVPQAAIFPHTAVMVCHGGSGTLLGGLAAGIPQVLIPLGADQPANAQRIAAIGAGLALKKPDVETLRAAIARVLDEPGFRLAAEKVAREMAGLQGMDSVLLRLLELAAKGGSST